jgi:long-chain fatty acid transport protein
MTKHPCTALTTALALSLFSFQVFAAAFGINEHGAKPMGIGGAYGAIADTPSAIFFNPAGLAMQEGLQLELGATLIAPYNSYRGIAPGTATEVEVPGVSNLFLLPTLYASYRLHEMVAVGIGMYAPYGLTTEWSEDEINVNGTNVGWFGRGTNIRTAIQTLFINPTVAVQVHPRILIGAGLAIVPGHVEVRRAVTNSAFVRDDVMVDLAGEDVGFGATAGVLVKVLPELLNVGLTYRGGVSFTMEGQAVFSKDGSANNIPAGLRTRLVDGAVEAAFNTPHVISFSLAAFPMEELTIGFSLDVITWSVLKELAIDFKDNPELSSALPLDWRNTVAVRIGAEYKVLPQLPVRAGFIFDQAPEPAHTLGATLPDGDRYILSLGVGYQLDMGLYADLAYMFVTTGDNKTSDNNKLVGVYQAGAHLVGLSIGYKLDM